MTPIAGIFAGQGAQFVGMGRDLADRAPSHAAIFAAAGDIMGENLAHACFEGPVERLTRSDICQPAIFVTSVVCWDALNARHGTLNWRVLAGLSLGEWTALHLAGVLDFETTIRILQARGRFMQEACDQTPGGMISVMGLNPEQIQTLCEQTGLTVANLNSDDQTVLSGVRDAIPEAERIAAALGAKRSIVLNVAGAFHSPLMMPAREKLATFVRDIPFNAPDRTVLSNVTGQPHPADGDAIRETMLRQITDSVRWVDDIRWCLAQSIRTVVEMGPGKVLGGLVKRIDRDTTLLNVQDVESLEKTAAALTEA